MNMILKIVQADHAKLAEKAICALNAATHMSASKGKAGG